MQRFHTRVASALIPRTPIAHFGIGGSFALVFRVTGLFGELPSVSCFDIGDPSGLAQR